MKILGIGVDIVENDRIKILLKKKNFLNRIFSKKEIFLSKKVKDKTAFFSKRFAAKEAFSKAIGTGFRNKLNFIDISVSNNKVGKPYFLLNNKVKNIIFKKFKIKSFKFSLSLSDEKKYSIAYVILQIK
jgi:holo-[acyl-carrier protein] synthase